MSLPFHSATVSSRSGESLIGGGYTPGIMKSVVYDTTTAEPVPNSVASVTWPVAAFRV